MNSFSNYLHTHYIEISGTLLCLIYLYFSIRQHILLWLFGILSSALYITVFFEAKLYADMSLQFYYVAVSLYGWIYWKQSRKKNSTHTLPVTQMAPRTYIRLGVATVGIYILYYVVLAYFSDSPIPALDSFVGALSIVGTWMLAKKVIENWLVWIVVDAFCVGLYLWRDLYSTSALYAVYTVMSVIGYRQWKKDLPPSC